MVYVGSMSNAYLAIVSQGNVDHQHAMHKTRKSETQNCAVCIYSIWPNPVKNGNQMHSQCARREPHHMSSWENEEKKTNTHAFDPKAMSIKTHCVRGLAIRHARHVIADSANVTKCRPEYTAIA